MNSAPRVGIKVTVHSPNVELMMSKVYEAEGKFSFTSHMDGEHTICLHSNVTVGWFSGPNKLRIHLDMQVGSAAIDYEDVMHKEKLTNLQLRVRQLLNQIEDIAKEQSYQRHREELFRATSESTNARVVWWAVFQTLVLVGMGFWQMKHMKRFFEAKKLV